jgi:hypothetical protein
LETWKEDAVKANELLLWMSARREGSWQQFRAAVDELNSSENDSGLNGDSQTGDNEFPLYQQLRLNLECAAHAEFFERDSKYVWRIAPPVLAAHPATDGFRAVLCGARSPALRERVLRVGHECGCETVIRGGVPEVIRLAASSINMLSDVAAQARVYFQPDASLAILSHIRPCNPPARRGEQSAFPIGEGWRIREFDPAALRWRASDRQRAASVRTGVLEFSLYDDWRYFLRWSGGTFKLPRAVAIYSLLRRHRGMLRYDEQIRAFSLPGACHPPRLLERALVLCSGFPPSFDPATSRLTYSDVPWDIARFVAELLRQPLP